MEPQAPFVAFPKQHGNVQLSSKPWLALYFHRPWEVEDMWVCVWRGLHVHIYQYQYGWDRDVWVISTIYWNWITEIELQRMYSFSFHFICRLQRSQKCNKFSPSIFFCGAHNHAENGDDDYISFFRLAYKIKCRQFLS